MLTISSEASVGQLVREVPARAKVFERFGIDFCCGGKLPVADACRNHQVDLDRVLDELQKCDASAVKSGELVDADAMTLTDLADHIEQTHHAHLREELPRLDRMTEKVARVHGQHEPRLLQVRDAFLALKAELEPHMLKEDNVLFPMIRQLEASTGLPEFHCGSLANPIRQMEHEHDQAGDALAIMRQATDDFVPPDWACNTYRAMLDGLEALEFDMHQHVHKENNVLFPKAVELEASRA